MPRSRTVWTKVQIIIKLSFTKLTDVQLSFILWAIFKNFSVRIIITKTQAKFTLSQYLNKLSISQLNAENILQKTAVRIAIWYREYSISVPLEAFYGFT